VKSDAPGGKGRSITETSLKLIKLEVEVALVKGEIAIQFKSDSDERSSSLQHPVADLQGGRRNRVSS